MNIHTTIGKIAIIHDAVLNYGGGEKILSLLSEMFPGSDLYSSVVFEEKKRLAIRQPIYTTFLQNIPLVQKKPILIQFLSPFIWNRVNLKKYDCIISIGGFYLSHIIERNRPKTCFHAHYCISHPFNLYPVRQTSKNLIEIILNTTWYPFLRYNAEKSMKKIPYILADSKYLQSFIWKHYGRNSTVCYPPVEHEVTRESKKSRRTLYVAISRLSPEKRLDILVNAFNKNGLPLVIIGSGRLEKTLKQKAKSNITFTGYRTSKEYGKIFSKTIAFVHTSPDDPLPMAPIEALRNGIPVIGFYGAGMKEIIIEGKTGLFFRKLSAKSLNNTIKKFHSIRFNSVCCKKHAEKFSEKHFLKNFPSMILSAYNDFKKL